MCNNCCTGGGFFLEDNIRHYIYATNYVRLAGRYTKDNMPVFKMLDQSRDGTVINANAFNLSKEWLEDFKNNIGKFKCYVKTDNDTTEKEIKAIEEKKEVVECPVCHEPLIVDDDDFCEDKHGNLLHRECADHTFTTCVKCGKTVPVSQLAQNYKSFNADMPEGKNCCMECYIDDLEIF